MTTNFLSAAECKNATSNEAVYASSTVMQHWADYLNSIEAGAEVIPFCNEAG